MMLSGMRKVLHVWLRPLFLSLHIPCPLTPWRSCKGWGALRTCLQVHSFREMAWLGLSLFSAFLQGLLPFTPPQLPRRALEQALRRGHASGTLPQSPLGLERMGRVTVPSCHPWSFLTLTCLRGNHGPAPALQDKGPAMKPGCQRRFQEGDKSEAFWWSEFTNAWAINNKGSSPSRISQPFAFGKLKDGPIRMSINKLLPTIFCGRKLGNLGGSNLGEAEIIKWMLVTKLTPYPPTHLCEQGFSAFTLIQTENKNRTDAISCLNQAWIYESSGKISSS